MEVTRQLRKEKLNKKNQAPIQLTFCWDGLRLRFSSGEKCHKDHWSKQEKVKDKPGAYATQVNTVLDNYTTAAESAYKDATQRNEKLSLVQMEAEIRRRYALLAAGKEVDAEDDVPALPQLEQPAPGFLDYMAQWIEYQASKVSLRSGKPLTKESIQALRRSRAALQEFAEQHQVELTFESMDTSFYQAFQHYQLRTLGRDVNTFGGHIKRLKSFLAWCEDLDLPVNRKFRRFEAPDVYRGADALTQQELLQLAAVDLSTAAVRAYVVEHFPPVVRTGHGGPPSRTVDEHLQRLAHTRDKVLQCCYFGLRLGDADLLAPQHLHQELVKIRANKNQVLCLIPYFDDDVFKPVQLVEKYAGSDLATCLPVVHDIHRYIHHVEHLAHITRISLTTRVGRKTFATLKIYQGVPKSQVMLATGHKTESSFNRYLGINEQELIQIFRSTARRVA